MRSKPVSRAAQAAITTAGHAFAIPSANPIRQFKLKVSAAAFVGIGTVLSPIPAAATSNTTYQDAGELVYTLNGTPQTDGSHLYVYAQSSTIDAEVSYYG